MFFPRFFAASLSVYSALSPFTSAHMEMSQPLPIRSRLDSNNTGDNVDFNLKSPLNADGSNYPCHGWQNDRPVRITATYTAGKTYQMSITGTVTHGGGSCQLSLSYDNGATFKAIKSMIGGCPLTQQYDFTIPSFAPSGIALFAWTWFNEIGNREMYMNCAEVRIAASSASRRLKSKRQSTFTSMNSLPDIWRANIQGLGSCTTTEGQDVVFPNNELGPDVVYGGSRTSSSAPDTQQNCGSPTPPGQTYKNLEDTASGSPSSSPSGVPGSSSSAPQGSSPAAKPSASAGTGGVFAEEATNGTTSSSSIATAPSPLATTTTPITNTTVNAAPPLSTTAPTTSAPVTQVFTGPSSYLSFPSVSNSATYLPCVPGAFLCTSASTYLLCDQAAGQTSFTPSSHYVGPLSAAAGMQCVPYLAQFLTPADTARFATNGTSGAVPVGWYRSDRYVSI